MKLKAKIQSIVQYLHYAWISKTKYKIHSPFVFQFIQNVLESSDKSVFTIYNNINKYYSKNKKTVSIVENAGEGSKILHSEAVDIHLYINKVGLPKKYGKVLAKISIEYSCKNVIELGTSLGISTSFLASNVNSQVHTIEANPGIFKTTQSAFSALGVTNVNSIQAYFDDVLPTLCKELAPISLVFIDGNHNKDATLRYFYMCLQNIDEQSILVFDDIYWSEGMQDAWNEIKKHPKVRLSIDLYRMGIVFFRKEQLTKEDFVLWY